MFVDRVLFPVTALGPGNRAAIWVAGCNRFCEKCANPELWERHGHQEIKPERLIDAMNRLIQKEVDGITITGGEPFDQAEELSQFLDGLSCKLDVLVFTGYRYEELLNKKEAGKLLSKIDVLIDGEYVDELNDNSSALRGSSNQRILYLNKDVQEKYEAYLSEGRKIQNFVYDYKTVSVGIHNRSL